MLGIEDLKQTRLAQDLLTEAKLEAVPEMLARGLTIKAVAEILKLELKQVRQVAEKEGCGQNPLIEHRIPQSRDPPKPPLERGASKPPPFGRGGLGGILSNYF
ncbi:MAG: hypothetical protein AB4352_26540 [Hormoscilla sp.]